MLRGNPYRGDGFASGVRLGRVLPALALVLCPGVAPDAAASRASLLVGATVVARTSIQAARTPPNLEVSAVDAARGYVLVRHATRLTITNNAPGGFAIDVWPTTRVFSAAVLSGTGEAIRVGPDGGTISARGARGAALTLDLDVRFELAPGLAPGRYPWPLQYQVRPLTGD